MRIKKVEFMPLTRDAGEIVIVNESNLKYRMRDTLDRAQQCRVEMVDLMMAGRPISKQQFDEYKFEIY